MPPTAAQPMPPMQPIPANTCIVRANYINECYIERKYGNDANNAYQSIRKMCKLKYEDIIAMVEKTISCVFSYGPDNCDTEKEMVPLAILRRVASDDCKSHPIPVKASAYLGTSNGNTRLKTQDLQDVITRFEDCAELIVGIDLLKAIIIAYPDQYQILDVHLVDQTIAHLFTEIDSMKCMAGDEADMERKQRELFSKGTTRHLVLELLYYDNKKGIMYFDWCNPGDSFQYVTHNWNGRLPVAYQRYWLIMNTKFGKICIPVYILALRQGIAPIHPQKDGADIQFQDAIYHGYYTLDGTLRINAGFDERFIDLVAYKAKYDHCNVSCTGDDASLGQWCGELRVSYKQIQNNQPPRMKLSNEQIKHLNDAGF
jgi:hypothetical protein